VNMCFGICTSVMLKFVALVVSRVCMDSTGSARMRLPMHDDHELVEAKVLHTTVHAQYMLGRLR
jgi:hypothetical protein